MDRPEDSPPLTFAYRFAPASPKPLFAPRNPHEALVVLQGGNEALGRFYDACRRGHFEAGETAPVIDLSVPEALGQPKGEDGLPLQYPFAVILGCSDARAPTEILFGQEFNDIFNIRVAGNVVTTEGRGSLMYALRTFSLDDPIRPRSLKLVVALGHRGCGAVRAAVTAYQGTGDLTGETILLDPIGAILKAITHPPLAVAARAFDRAHGDGASRDPAHFLPFSDLVVYLNAAWSGRQLRGVVESQGEEIASRIGVVYGVLDPADHRVHSRPHAPGDHEAGILARPPADLSELEELASVVVSAQRHTAKLRA